MIEAHWKTITPSLMDNIQLFIIGKPALRRLHIGHLWGDLKLIRGLDERLGQLNLFMILCITCE